MRIAMTLLSIALAIGTTACKSKDKDKPSTGTGSSAPMAGSSTEPSATGSGAGGATGSAGSAEAAAGPAAAAGSDGAAAGSGADMAAGEPEMSRKAGKCPSTVFGATTTAELKGKNVLLTIASDDKDAVLAIQKRTELLLKEKQLGGGGGEGHDQKGTHGGGMGLCPVFLGEGGTATAKNQPKGVLVTIAPKGSPEDLKSTIDRRIAKSAEWVTKNIKPGEQGNAGGVGGGGGQHGSMHKGAGDAKGKERKDGAGGKGS